MASSPKPPNPYTQASADQKAQSGAAIQSSIINNPNEYGPYGNQVYSIAGWEQTPDATGKMIMTPRYNRTTTLSPDEQKIANLETGTRYNVGTTAMDISSRLPAYMRGSVDSSGWAPWQTGQAFDQSTDRPTIERNMMESYRRGTQPQQKAEDAQLAARGLSPGSAGFGTVQQGREDAAGEASRQAYLASGNEARQNYGTAMSYWDMVNQLRPLQEQSSYAQRNQPLNEIAALAQLSQVNMPQFSPYSRQGISAASPGQYMASNYGNQVNAAGATNSGLFGLGGAGMNMLGSGFGKGMGLAAMFGSDRRLKEDIERVEGELAGLPLYEFAYRLDPAHVRRIGVMSDDARIIHPDAVVVHASGYDMVDYGLLMRRHANG